jgi:hypothetical protein
LPTLGKKLDHRDSFLLNKLEELFRAFPVSFVEQGINIFHQTHSADIADGREDAMTHAVENREAEPDQGYVFSRAICLQ